MHLEKVGMGLADASQQVQKTRDTARSLAAAAATCCPLRLHGHLAASANPKSKSPAAIKRRPEKSPKKEGENNTAA